MAAVLDDLVEAHVQAFALALADRCGFARSYMSRIETIAGGLRVPVMTLFED
jgi:hypothetical protein